MRASMVDMTQTSVLAPVSGRAVALADVPDPVFSAGMVGYGAAVDPPRGIVEAVARGIDMMDCVLPTRLARHGTLLTTDGKVNIRRAEFARDDERRLRRFED